MMHAYARCSRTLSFVALCLSSFAAAGCSSEPNLGEQTENTTSVDQSAIENQAIGNCWIYAASSWLESLQKAATGEEIDTSQSHLTYWSWFERITNGLEGETVPASGGYARATDLIARYGIIREVDFIPEERNRETSLRQRDAYFGINRSLANGALKTPEARANRALVRSELNRVFGLSPEMIADYDAVFGVDAARTIENDWQTEPLPQGSRIIRATDFPAALRDPKTHERVVKTLADAIGKHEAPDKDRTGDYAWRAAGYPKNEKRRAHQKRVQRALADSQPVILTWHVHFTARDSKGRFTRPQAPVSPGGSHMVVMHDYEVENVPGFGTLPAGMLETRPDALQAALDDNARIVFIRIKNSWGTEGKKQYPIAGYNDLYLDYLDGPLEVCDPNEVPPTTGCTTETPWAYSILPAGY